MKFKVIVGICLCIVLSIVACQKEDVKKDKEPTAFTAVPTLPDETIDYNGFQFPEHFYQPPTTFILNTDPQVHNEQATLGRVLFYDKRLSKTEEYACASCHHQDKAFTDGEVGSKGVDGGFTDRNSMSITNMILSNRFFWDQRVVGLVDQAIQPILSPHELGLTLDELEAKISAEDFYEPLFTNAFGDATVTSDRVANALAEFMKSIVTYDSKYDKGHTNDFADFTDEETLGKDLFFSGQFNCNQCHNTNTFTAFETMNNGLDLEYADKGFGDITANQSDNGKFKVPTLRNIALTAPYMHDGRFKNLDEVIEQYNSNIQAHPNLNDRLTEEVTTGGTPLQYNMTDIQKSALKAFLLTLTDETFLADPKWSNPFPE